MTTDTRHSVLPLLCLSGARTWEMPQLPGLGKLPPRATLVPFPWASDALTLDRNHSLLVAGQRERLWPESRCGGGLGARRTEHCHSFNTVIKLEL